MNPGTITELNEHIWYLRTECHKLVHHVNFEKNLAMRSKNYMELPVITTRNFIIYPVIKNSLMQFTIDFGIGRVYAYTESTPQIGIFYKKNGKDFTHFTLETLVPCTSGLRQLQKQVQTIGNLIQNFTVDDVIVETRIVAGRFKEYKDEIYNLINKI